ncbi:YicC/YloC family endoribonuclease [uncultured Thiohalocapsa sp.]|mgnify:CR=1 FL=1|uniref:YicC/YloC family endoribonuclease n=1 Tax=uncultured Thiohalocapsa sp. TaxID=768990 RepID=UPI0025F2C1B9|nr:YicC/YloC family endoribonuclease [uncultured Thiohalocapsa sp.]
MTRSMTAFAREHSSTDLGELTWELRSVNHRFLEPHVRLPEDLRALETPVRERLSARLARGKVDCTLRFVPSQDSAGGLKVNRRLLEQVLNAADEIATRIGEPATPHVLDLLRWPGLLEEPEQDPDAVAAAALALLDQALDGLVAHREREGERLRALLLERCDKLLALVADVRERMPQVLEGVRTRIRERLTEVLDELDPARLEQEMALLAQRLDVDEEMDRLSVHVEEVRKTLAGDAPVGRRLDFLMQELNREANTLSSKSADAETTHAAVEMKVLIEQMREQVQNLE